VRFKDSVVECSTGGVTGAGTPIDGARRPGAERQLGLRRPCVHLPVTDAETTISVLEHCGLAFVVIGRDGRGVYMSPSALQFLGDSPVDSVLWQTAVHLAAQALSGSRSQTQFRGSHIVLPGSGMCFLVARSVMYRRPPAGVTAIVAVVVLQPAPSQMDGQNDADNFGLTKREAQVAYLVATGRSTKEIAAALSISQHTARRHTERVFAKLGVRGRVSVSLLLAGGRGLTVCGADDERRPGLHSQL